ncbi:DUF4942 domain-containing protein, partial [Escherichia coli]
EKHNHSSGWHIQSVQGKECYEDEMFSIRYFKKGSAHITFKHPELMES